MMPYIATYVRGLVRNRDGLIALDYGLIAALIAVVILGALTLR